MSAREAFVRGFELAIRRWRDAGEDAEELIERSPRMTEPEQRGARAAWELIMGWEDVAEIEARRVGFCQKGEARLFVEAQKKDLDRRVRA